MPEERFRFPEEALHAAAGRTRRRLAATLAVAAVGVVAFWGAFLRTQGASLRTLIFSLAFLLVLAALSMRRRMRRLHARWGTFEVTIGPDAVVRDGAGAAPVRIARADVLALEERSEGIVVRSRDGSAMLVPRGLERFERARDLLGAWSSPRS